MSSIVHLYPCTPVDGTIRPPGSKSITNRAIVCAALATGTSRLSGVLDSEDTQVMISAWQQVGLQLAHDRAGQTLSVEGSGGELPIRDVEMNVANSGTTMRFLAAALCACNGQFTLDGVPRMRERPMGDLLRALSKLGADIASQNGENPDCPPVQINAGGLKGGKTSIAGSISSQFLSGLMMAAPMAESDVYIDVVGKLVSVPYVEMTAAVMRAFGADVQGRANESITIHANRKYNPCEYTIEPDASAASYFWGAAAITGGRARVQGLSKNSLQGDVGFCEVLEQMGCDVSYETDSIVVQGRSLQGVDVEMTDISDTVQTLAAVALFASGPTTVRGVAHNRNKETDRISDLACELRKLGARIEEFPDGLTITPPAEIQPAEIQTYDDHRMAMSLALVGLRAEGIAILDPDCTRKTYPGFWEDLESFCGCRIERSN